MHYAFPRTVATGVLLLAGTLLCSGCYTWAWTGPPERDHPGTVRVTRQDSSALVLHNASVAQDTLVGSTSREPSAPADVQIPIKEVEKIEQRRIDPVRTGALIAALPAVTVVWLILSFTTSTGF
jgi:hypothetical protein